MTTVLKFRDMYDLLSKFGLDEKEAPAFLELVRLGAAPVSSWAKQVGINRTTMYVFLDRLSRLGLVTTFTHKGVLHAQAVATSELIAILNDKEDALVETKELLKKYLPELQKLEKTHGITPKVRFFEGIKKVELMYEEVLKEISFKAYFHPGRVKSKMPGYFHKIPQTLKARGGKAQELLVRCKEANEYMDLYCSTSHQMAQLPKNINFSSDTIITPQKIFLIGYGTDDAVGTEVWNEELAKTQSAIFDLVWNGLQLA